MSFIGEWVHVGNLHFTLKILFGGGDQLSASHAYGQMESYQYLQNKRALNDSNVDPELQPFLPVLGGSFVRKGQSWDEGLDNVSFLSTFQFF